MITPMLRPDLFGALATHAGDASTSCCYIPEFGKARPAPARLRPRHPALVGRLPVPVAFTKEEDGDLLDDARLLAPASPPPRTARRSCRSTRVPAQLRPEVWQRWLDWDPVRMVDRVRRRAALACGPIWIDAGTRDEWFLDLGAEAFRAGLARVGVPDERVHFELFDAGHGGDRVPLPDGTGLAGHRLDPAAPDALGP